MHGDKNKADDISWPFYPAIDEILGNLTLPQRTRRRRVSATKQPEEDYEEEEEEDEDLNPQEFLSVSVAPDDYEDDEDDRDSLANRLNIHFSEEEEEEEDEIERKPAVPRLHPLKQEVQNAGRSPVFDISRTKGNA